MNGILSKYYIADRQISITNNPDSVTSNISRSSGTGLPVILNNPGSIKIDFTDSGTRESPYIHQILIGPQKSPIELTTVDSNNVKKTQIIELKLETGVLEIGTKLSSVEIRTLSPAVVISLQVIGCFEEKKGCVLDGKYYNNHQAINSTSADKCSTKICYCEDQKVHCRSTPETTICKQDEVKACSKPSPDLTCCTCVKNVTEVYCKIDYLCNPQCGVCLDESDMWGKESKIANGTQCVCKDGYQSSIQPTDEMINGIKITRISAICMSATNDNTDCGSTTPIVTTTTKSPPTVTTTTTSPPTVTTTTTAPPIVITTTKEPPTVTTTTTSPPTVTTTKTAPPIVITTTSAPPTVTTTTTSPPTVTTTTTAPPIVITTTSEPPTVTTTTKAPLIVTTTTTAPPIVITTTSEPPTVTTTTIAPPTPTKIVFTETAIQTLTPPPPTVAPKSTVTIEIPPPTTTGEQMCTYHFCEEYNCNKDCIDGEGRPEKCSRLKCGNNIEVFKNSTHIICARIVTKNCGSTPSVPPVVTTTTVLTTVAPCTFINGILSKYDIADRQISITNNPNIVLSNIPRESGTGISIVFTNPGSIKIDFTDSGTRENPYIHQILIGLQKSPIELTTIDSNNVKNIQTIQTISGVLEIGTKLSSVEIRTLNAAVAISLRVIGCFVEKKGCVIDGKYYDNRQSINGSISGQCSTKFCYCEDQEVQCRYNPDTTTCTNNEIKVCSKPNPDLTCCSCVKNVTEIFCQIDYLCNSQCGVCVDGIDAWGKETRITNSALCVCKDGYQSFIESSQKTVGGTTTTRISAKCMSATNDNSDCGNQTVTTILPPTQSVPPKSTVSIVTVSETLPETTSSTTPTVTQSVVTTRPERNCFVGFCEKLFCNGTCDWFEGRREQCDRLLCRGTIEYKRNSTHVFCARVIQQECSSSTIEITSVTQRPIGTSSLPAVVTVLTTKIVTEPAMCVLVTCTVYSCSDRCQDEVTMPIECVSLKCDVGKIMIKKNQTHMWCSNSMERNCLTSPLYTTTKSSQLSTTTAISECNPILKLNTDKYVSLNLATSNPDGLTLEKWMSSTADFVPQLEMKLRNTMKLIQLELYNVSNIKKMQILTSEDGKYFNNRHYYTGGFSTLERYISFNFTNEFVLALKVVVFEKYQTSLGVVFNLEVSGCGKVCQLPMVHVECLCPQTCDSIANNKGFAVCPKSCFPGCECPEGMVNENGKCIKVTECPCFYKGRSYAFGEKIVTDDPCKQLVCTKESLQEVVLENCTNVCKETMEPCPCDGCHKTCDRNNLKDNCDLNSCKSGCCCPKGTVYSEVLQKCVKHCPCIYENTTYNVGDNWTNRCLKCTCDPERGAFCKEDGCHFDTCPPRQKRVNEDPNDNVCCKCVPIDPICTFNHKEYNVGEIWNDGPCRTYKCVMDNGKPTVTTDTVTCQQMECGANEQMIMVAGKCCPICVPRNITTTMRASTTTQFITTTTPIDLRCHVSYESRKLQQGGCTSTEKVQVGSCEGLCFGRSELINKDGAYKVSKQCTCCQPELSSSDINYQCSDGIKVMKTQNIVGCKCNECL